MAGSKTQRLGRLLQPPLPHRAGYRRHPSLHLIHYRCLLVAAGLHLQVHVLHRAIRYVRPTNSVFDSKK